MRHRFSLCASVPLCLSASAALWLCAFAPLPLAQADPLDSAARISRREGQSRIMGSGAVIGEDAGHWYVLTNAHVAGSRKGGKVEVEFYAGGRETDPIAGTVVWAVYRDSRGGGGNDAAIVAVPKRDLQNAPARVDLRSAAIAPGQTIESAGSPGGSWPNMFRGHVVDVRGNLIEFIPQPKQGRSGSAMVDLDGRIVGIITWADPQNGTGLAQTWTSLESHLKGGPRRGREEIAAREAGGLETIPWVQPADQPYRPFRPSRPNGPRPAGQAAGELETIPWIEPLAAVETAETELAQGPAQGLAQGLAQCPPGGCPPGQGQMPGMGPFRRAPPRPQPSPGQRPTPSEPNLPSETPIEGWPGFESILPGEPAPPAASPPSSPPPAQPTPPPLPPLPPATGPYYGPYYGPYPADPYAADPAAGRWWRPFQRPAAPAYPAAPGQDAGLWRDGGLLDLVDWLANQLGQAFTDSEGNPIKPGEAIEEVKKLNERMERLDAQWEKTNGLLEKTNGNVWYAVAVIVLALVIRALLPVILTRILGADEAAKLLSEVRQVRGQRIEPPPTPNP